MAAVRLRTGMAMVAASRAVTGGALLVVGLALGASGRIGDFGVLARAIAIAHLAVQFTDAGGLAAFTARSADPISASLRQACRWWLARRVAGRAVVIGPIVAGPALVFDVPPVLAVIVFAALAGQRLAAELLRSDGRTVDYAVVSGLPSGLWLVACLVVVATGPEPTVSLVTVLYAAIVGATAGLALFAVLGSPPDPEPTRVTDTLDSLGDRIIQHCVKFRGSFGRRPKLQATGAVPSHLAGRSGLFVEGLLEAAVRNIDVVLVAVVVGRDEAGLYAVASRLVAVAMTPLAAANGALAREYAERWAAGGPSGLSSLARPVVRRITGFPAAMTIGAAVVAAVLGDDGGTGTVALVAAVLLAAATVSTGAGSAGLLLGICRREVASARMSAVAVTGSVLLLLLLGWIGGLVPAAAGFAIGVAGQNIAQAWYLRHHLGVVSHA